MTLRSETLPISRPLPGGLAVEEAFHRLCHLPGLLWLDSAVGGRYSFMTADPIRSLVANVNDPDPWPTLRQWCGELPLKPTPGLPPFQGGIAGLIGYEAATWLEPVGMAINNDLPTPAISLGLYDWDDRFRSQR